MLLLLLPNSGHAVIDHWGYDGKLGADDHTAVLASALTSSPAVLPGGLSGPVLFRGIGLSVGENSETVREGQQAAAAGWSEGWCCLQLEAACGWA